MAEYYKRVFRVPATRLDSWDYRWNAAYFVTICTKGRKHWFGKVSEGDMHLNAFGKIAEQCWLDIPRHFPFVELDAHVVMPNHIHGIVIINKTDDGSGHVETQNLVSPPLGKVERSLIDESYSTGNRFGPQSENLPSIIRGYKVGVTSQARKLHQDFGWQKRYHDHIIRDDKSYEMITAYIESVHKVGFWPSWYPVEWTAGSVCFLF